jgi:hypothetical protein
MDPLTPLSKATIDRLVEKIRQTPEAVPGVSRKLGALFCTGHHMLTNMMDACPQTHT